MNKRELIEQIMKLNRSARREVLEGFSERELRDYLDQLSAINVTALWSTAGSGATAAVAAAPAV